MAVAGCVNTGGDKYTTWWPSGMLLMERLSKIGGPVETFRLHFLGKFTIFQAKMFV